MVAILWVIYQHYCRVMQLLAWALGSILAMLAARATYLLRTEQ